MKVLCEQYQNMKTKYECDECEHSKPHEYNKDECEYDADCSYCGICSIKPLRKQKIQKLNESI